MAWGVVEEKVEEGISSMLIVFNINTHQGISPYSPMVIVTIQHAVKAQQARQPYHDRQGPSWYVFHFFQD